MPDQADYIASLLQGMSKGQFWILTEAVRQLGGEVRFEWRELAETAGRSAARLEVDGEDGAIVLRVHDLA